MISSLKKAPILLVIILVYLSFTSITSADTINGSGTAAWQDWTATDLNNNGSPFWDSSSWDGTERNIGYCLAGYCGLANAPGPLPYWGENDDTANRPNYDSSLYFEGSPDSHDEFTIRLELAGYENTNEFGWYDYSQPSVLHTIFYGSDGENTPAKEVVISANYGFYFRVPSTGQIYYTQSEYNSTDKGIQHFAIFKETDGIYWMGMEDLSFRNTDKDYNDMIVRFVDPTPVPEPSTLALFGIGIAGVYFLKKKFIG